MKNWLLLCVFTLGTAAVFAQQNGNKKLEKRGDFISATVYYENGSIHQKGFYNEAGLPQGTWTSYNMEGNKTVVAQYDNGIKVGTWFFYNEDVLKEVTYTDNKVSQIVTWKDSEKYLVSY